MKIATIQHTFILKITILVVFIGCCAMELTAQEKFHVKAIAMHQNQQYDSAIVAATKALDKGIYKSKMYLLRGKSFYKKGKYSQAINDFHQIKHSEPTLSSILIAQSYARIQQNDSALYYLKKHLDSPNKRTMSSIKLDPAFTKLKSTSQWQQLWLKDWYNEKEKVLADAEYLITQEQFYDALEMLDTILIKNQHWHQAFSLRAIAYEMIGQPKDAISDYTLALEIQPSNIQYLIKRAELYTKIEKYKKALEDYNLAINKDRNNPLLFRKRAQIYTLLENYEDGLKDMEFYMEIDKHNPEAQYEYGMIYFKNEQYLEALRVFNPLIKKYPFQSKYFVARGNTYHKTNTLKYAYNDYSMALDFSPYEGKTYFNRGIVRLKMGDKKGACSDWNKALHYNCFEAIEYLRKYCK